MTHSAHPLWRLTVRLSAHADLSEADIAAILDLPHTLASRRQSAYLVREGDQVQSTAVLVSGYVVRHRTTRDGNRQVVAVYVPGDPLDLDHLFVPLADDDLQVARPAARGLNAEIALIPNDALRELMWRRPAVAFALVTALVVDMAIYREWVLNVGQREAVKKVGHLLCEIALRMELQGLETEGVMPLSQILIAEATGLTPVHVNRMLRVLQEEGLVTRKDQVIAFPDWRALSGFSDFDPHYLNIRSLPAEPA